MKPLWTKDFTFAFVANFFMAFSFYLLLPTLPAHLIHTMRTSSSMAGVIMSAYVVAGLCFRPFAGFLIDRLPHRPLYVATFALFTLFFLLYFGAVSVWIFLGLRILHGLVWGMIIPAGSTIAIDIVPPERRGEGIGYYGMSMNIAMAFGPLVGILLQDHLSFSWVLAVAAGGSFLGLFNSLLIRVPSHTPSAPKALAFDQFILKKGIAGGVAMLFITVSYGLLLTYASIYGKQHDIPGTGVFFVLVSIGFIVARAAFSPLLDKGWALRLALAGALAITVALIALGLFPLAAVYFATGMVFGLAYGLVFPALQSWMVGRALPHQRGTANSTFFTAFDLGVGAGMLFGGRMVDHGNLANAFYVCALSSVVGILLLRRLPKR